MMTILSTSRRSSSEIRTSSKLQPQVGADPAAQRVGDRLGLLGDLLEHEVLVAVLLGGRGVPVDVVAPGLHRPAGEVGDHHAAGPQLDDLVLADLHRLAGVRDEGRHVGGQEVLALSEADDERGVAARAHDDVRAVGVHGDEGERALQPAADPAHRLGQVIPRRLVRLGEQVRDDLGVGVGAHLVAARLQLGAQGREVLDDAVVDHRDPRVVVEVRVGVAVVGGPVGGPAGVTHPGGGRGQLEREAGQVFFEVGQLAGALAGLQHPAGDERDARRVVPAVLQPPQPVDDDLERGLASDVSHDAAHGNPSYDSASPAPSRADRRRAGSHCPPAVSQRQPARAF